MRRRITVWLAIACVLALTLSASGPSLAAGHGSGKGAGGENAQGHAYGHFSDVSEGNWSYRYVTMMEVKEVFGGYGNGKFGPQDSVSNLQLAILAVRITGNQEAALALTQAEVDAALAGTWLDAADPIPDWPGAPQYLAYAYQNGYLNGYINLELVTFRPTASATRLEVIVTLIDAMGLADAAAALAGATITAPDASTVPAWAVGYVALAIDMGLLRGDNAGVLKLNSAVTRAEMAALLCRANDQQESDVDDKTIKAELVSVVTGTAPTITVNVKGEELNEYAGEDEEEDEETEGTDEETEGTSEEQYTEHEIVTVTYPVTADATIFRAGATATLDQLVAGDRLELRLDADGNAIFIDAEAPKAEEHDGALEVSGPYVSAQYTGEVLSSITIIVAVVGDEDEEEDEDEADEDSTGTEGDAATGPVVGEQATFNVSPDVELRGFGNGDATFVDGDYLSLKIVDDLVAKIDANRDDEDEDEDEADDEVEGKISATFVSTAEGQLTFTVVAIDEGENLPETITVGAEVTLPLAEDLEIDGEDDLTLADLTAGTAIALDIENGAITEIKVGGGESEDEEEEEEGDD